MKLGLVGVPVESLSICSEDCRDFFIPHITDDLRDRVIREAKRRGVNVEDLGELKLGEEYELDFRLDRSRTYYDRINVRPLDFSKFLKERKRVLDLAKHHDHLIALGPSHIGALILYSKGDRVARFDFHGDYERPHVIDGHELYTFYNYIHWAKQNIGNIEVGNYFWNAHSYFGEILRVDDPFGESCNHFDIDVDFLLNWIQTVYNVSIGRISRSYVQDKIEFLYRCLRCSKPGKLGIWEYRLDKDPSGEGVDFITESIINSI